MEYIILAAVLASYIAIMGELHSIKRLLELLVAPPVSGPTPVAADLALCSICGKNPATEAGDMCKECFPF